MSTTRIAGTIKQLNVENNSLYNIINIENKKVVFNYLILLVVIIVCFKHIEINLSIIVGLIFFAILIYYFNTYRRIHNLEESQLQTSKFEAVSPTNDILKPYNQINDFLFYFLDFKNINIQKYDKLTELLENFITMYEAVNIEPKMISLNYQKMQDLKLEILDLIDSYIFCVYENTYTDIIYKNKLSCEIILNSYLDKVDELQKQYLKIHGFNTGTKFNKNNAILPANFEEGLF